MQKARPWPGNRVAGPASCKARGTRILVPTSCTSNPARCGTPTGCRPARRVRPRRTRARTRRAPPLIRFLSPGCRVGRLMVWPPSARFPGQAPRLRHHAQAGHQHRHRRALRAQLGRVRRACGPAIAVGPTVLQAALLYHRTCGYFAWLLSFAWYSSRDLLAAARSLDRCGHQEAVAVTVSYLAWGQVCTDLIVRGRRVR